MSSGVEGKRERGVQAGGTPRCQNNARAAAKAYQCQGQRGSRESVEGEKKRKGRRKIGEKRARATKKKEHVVVCRLTAVRAAQNPPPQSKHLDDQ
jgi:hypothetical protein